MGMQLSYGKLALHLRSAFQELKYRINGEMSVRNVCECWQCEPGLQLIRETKRITLHHLRFTASFCSVTTRRDTALHNSKWQTVKLLTKL
jgi:hypothetical protein